MKLLINCILIIALASQLANGSELKSEKSQALLKDIKEDISNTLSVLDEYEVSNNWTVYLSRQTGSTTKMGIVVDPSSNLVLTVAANSIAAKVGVKPGDIINAIVINKQLFKSGFSSLLLQPDDSVKLNLIRAGEKLVVEGSVDSEYVPDWQLYSQSDVDKAVSLDLSKSYKNIDSMNSMRLLDGLQERINRKLADIYRIEMEIENNNLKGLVQDKTESTRLGAIVDKRTKKVIGITSDSNADELGLSKDDVILEIKVNGITYFEDIAGLKIRKGDKVEIKVKRNNRLGYLSIIAFARVTPSWKLEVESPTGREEGCGVITFLFSPKFASDIYNAEATKIDGESVLSSKKIHYLESGKHILKLYDKIPSREVLPSFSRKRPYKESKELQVDVKPNKRYYIAAKFHRDKRWKVRNGEYWEPYVWKVDDYECSSED